MSHFNLHHTQEWIKPLLQMQKLNGQNESLKETMGVVKKHVNSLRKAKKLSNTLTI
jgi:hypothetical protein